jgi:hypothetical protein
MDDINYGIRSYNPMERVIHALHMIEVWKSAGAIYKKNQVIPPSTESCQCLADADGNGVLQSLKELSLTLRTPKDGPIREKGKYDLAYEIYVIVSDKADNSPLPELTNSTGKNIDYECSFRSTNFFIQYSSKI